jgi:thiol-disulfide isomerase/thioredoxin
VELIRDSFNGIDVTIFFGTWCSDSRRELPRFLKVADMAGIPPDRITLYGLDRSKKSPDGLTEKYHIDRVATFIFFKKGVEIGRITEAPESTIEGDMITILTGGRAQ